MWLNLEALRRRGVAINDFGPRGPEPEDMRFWEEKPEDGTADPGIRLWRERQRMAAPLGTIA